MKEIISIQLGSAGNAIGESYWKLVRNEHDLSSCSGSVSMGDISVLFREEKSGNHFRRAIRCDLSSSDYSKSATIQPDLDPSNILISDSGSDNCYAKAFHTTGPPIAQSVVERVRRELERCDCIHAVQFLHSSIGGTGSGLGGLLMKSLRDYINGGSKCMFVSGCLVPAPSSTDSLLSVFNTVLCLHDLSEYCHLAIPFDVEALVSKPLRPFDTISRCISGLTSSMRFPGVLNTDLRKIHSLLIPFKNANFLIPSYASSREHSFIDLTHDALDRHATCISIDPQLDQSRYLASLLSFRGHDIQPSQVDAMSRSIQEKGSRYDKFFPDWIPNSISASLASSDASLQKDMSLTTFSNNTGIHQFHDTILSAWDKQFKARSHVYIYEENGIHPDEMLEARNLVQYVSDQYKEYSKWKDKILVKPANSGWTVNETSLLSADQRSIANELLRISM